MTLRAMICVSVVALPFSAANAQQPNRLSRAAFGIAVLDLDAARAGIPKEPAASDRDAESGSADAEQSPNKLHSFVQGDVSASRFGFPKFQSDLPTSQKGVTVLRVLPHSPAATFGIAERDIIVRVNGSILDGNEAWDEFAKSAQPGKEVVLDVAKFRELKGRPLWLPAKKVKMFPTTGGELAISSMRSEVDEIDKKKTWIHRTAPKPDTTSSLAVQFSEENGVVSRLRLRVECVTEKGIGLGKITLAAGESRHDIAISDVRRRVLDDGKICESQLLPITAEELAALRSLASGFGHTIRYSGSDAQHDREILQKEIDRILFPLDAYEAMGGKLD